MKKIFAAFIVLGLLTCIFSGSAAAQAASAFQARVKTDKPLEPSLTLTNTTGQACQVASTALGTVSVTEVTQNGEPVVPQPVDIAFDQSMPGFLTGRLQTLEPGSSLTIPLRVVEITGGYALESVAWSQETGPYALAYPITNAGPLDITLSYGLPIQPAQGAPACPVVTAYTDNSSGNTLINIAFWLGGAFLAIAIALLIIWLLRKKRSKAVAAVLLLIFGGVFPYAPVAQAEISNTESVQSQFDACIAILEEHNDITGEVLETINRGTNIVLRPNSEGMNDTVDYRRVDGNIYIYWDPTNTHEYAGTGGTSSPCDSLYHEMFHAHELLWGIFDGGECGGSGIRTSEVNATRAQNVLRGRLGLPQRSHYGADPLPSGDCSDPPEPEPCEGDGCGETNGDPHLRTFDALRYDFQAAGEFILAQDTTNDDYAIQVRQTPWPGSRQVTVNQAVAAKVGSDTVEIVMRQNQPMLLINGIESETKTGDLPGGGKIVAGHRLTQIAWPDGSTLTVRAIGSFGLHLITDPASPRKGKLEGILGNYSGNSKDDLKLRGTDTIIQPEFDQLYPAFADSWRITNETSLFNYQDGADTNTYTDRSFPDAPTDNDNLPGRTAAEDLCRRQNITEPTVLENCILDVALTGRPEFAASASIGQSVTARADGSATWRVKVSKPDEAPRVSFEAKAGDRIFINIFNSTLPDQCGMVTLHSSSRQIASGCLSNGAGFIDTHVLPADGTYTIVVDPSGRETGTVDVRLVMAIFESRKMAINGESVSVDLAKPGSSATFNFTGQAGQKIFAEVLTTLPDQCGTLVLRGPDDARVDSSCISDGRGELDHSGITLPKSGEYNLTIDPANTTTGEVAVRLYD